LETYNLRARAPFMTNPKTGVTS